jgi:membrane protease subunit HflC
MSITSTISRHPIYAAVIGLVLAVLASMTFTVVPETQQGIILRYGEFQRVVNPWRERQNFGGTGAGLVARIPFVEQIQLVDKRMLGVQLDGQPVLSTDQLRVEVDAYARFRIVDAERMYTSIRTEDRLKAQLSTLLSSSLRNELGRRTFASLLSAERGQVMANIQRSLSREAVRYGARIVDVRINRADLPQETQASVFDRMRSARDQEAAAIKSGGQREAQVIRAEADAEAARIYADSFGKDPQFYAFYRAMQSYIQTFTASDAGETTFVLPPGEGYLSEMNGR